MSLKEWFGKGPKGDWVDIGAPKKKGKYQPCGRKSASKSKRGYPKCVPRAKARSMSKSQTRCSDTSLLAFQVTERKHWMKWNEDRRNTMLRHTVSFHAFTVTSMASRQH